MACVPISGTPRPPGAGGGSAPLRLLTAVRIALPDRALAWGLRAAARPQSELCGLPGAGIWAGACFPQTSTLFGGAGSPAPLHLPAWPWVRPCWAWGIRGWSPLLLLHTKGKPNQPKREDFAFIPLANHSHTYNSLQHSSFPVPQVMGRNGDENQYLSKRKKLLNWPPQLGPARASILTME